jgi:hypothetical protein
MTSLWTTSSRSLLVRITDVQIAQQRLIVFDRSKSFECKSGFASKRLKTAVAWRRASCSRYIALNLVEENGHLRCVKHYVRTSLRRLRLQQSRPFRCFLAVASDVSLN